MGEVLQAVVIVNLLKNSLKYTKYFSYSYYLLFILYKLKEAKVKLFRQDECTLHTSLRTLLSKPGTGSDQSVAKESTSLRLYIFLDSICMNAYDTLISSGKM